MKNNEVERIEALMTLRKRHTDEDIIEHTAELGCDVEQVKKDLRIIDDFLSLKSDFIITGMLSWRWKHTKNGIACYTVEQENKALKRIINKVEKQVTLEWVYDSYINAIA